MAVLFHPYGWRKDDSDKFVSCVVFSLLTDIIQRVKDQHKAQLKEKSEFVFEGMSVDLMSLNCIYTELYITPGESEGVKKEHEILQIEDT